MNVALALTCLMLPLSLYLLVRNPFNAASVVAVLTWLFGILPAYYFVSTGTIPSYSWRNMTYLGGPLSNGVGIESALLALAVMSAAFTLGCAGAEMIKGRGSRAAQAPALRPTSELTSLVLIGAWGVSALYFFALSGWRIDVFLLPVREDVDASGYMKTIFMTVPLVLFAKAYWRNGKLDKVALFWLAIALLVAFSRPQRRDLITIVMFVIAFIPLSQASLRDQIKSAAGAVNREVRNRLVAISAMVAALALVPILWYSRVYFTASAEGQNLDPTRIRSFSELLLGSPATGFPTFLLVERHVSNYGFDPLHTFTYLATIFIPRSLWSGKPTDIDRILENKYQLIENPSIFWFGELYYGFGMYSIALALLFGFALYGLSRWAASSGSLLVRSFAALMFMHSITLFKNGLSHFVINAATIAVLLVIAWAIPDRRTERTSSAIPVG